MTYLGYNLTDGMIEAVIVFCLGYALCHFAFAKTKLSTQRVALIYVWHSIFAVLYVAYVLADGGDSIAYMVEAQHGIYSWSPGSDIVSAIAAALQAVLGNNLLPVGLCFALAGAFGLLLFDLALAELRPHLKGFWLFVVNSVVFLPSLSFWSSGIGKDSIAILAVGLFTYAMVARRPIVFVVLSVAIMFLVRPHVAAFLGGSFGLSLILAQGYSPALRIALLSTVAALAFLAAPFLLQYVGIGAADVGALSEYIDDRQSVNLGGGSSIDLAGMNPAYRVVTFVFRPYVFEANSVFALMAGLENFILLALLAGWALRRNRVWPSVRWQPGLIYAAVSIILFSQTIANLGLASRQKWMALVPLIFIALSAEVVRHYRERQRSSSTGLIQPQRMADLGVKSRSSPIH